MAGEQVVVGCDSNGEPGDSNTINTVSAALQQAGYSVETLSIGPSPFANYDYSSASSGKIGVYLMAASIVSIADAMSHQGFDRVVFGLRGDLGLRGTTEFDSAPWSPDSDCTAVCDEYSGLTGAQIHQKIQPRGAVVVGNSPEELAQVVVAAVGGTYNGTGTGTGQGTVSNVSPLLTGDMTFEELVGEICNGIDLQFICKRSTVYVSDFESIFAEAKYLRDNHPQAVDSENVKLWQMEEDSYELEVNQHGFYNTVIVNYKDGKVKESYDDFVRVYGEVPITYDDPSVDKTTAIMKAKAYLAAHLRDLEMMVKTSMLSEPDIDVGDIIQIENPMTMRDKIRTDEGRDPEYLFVNGISTNWEGESAITTDLECKFAPTSPKRLEVPTAGVASGSSQESSTASTGDVQAALDEVGKQWSGVGYSGECQTADCVKQANAGDCWGVSDLIYTELKSKGVEARVMQYPTAYASNHRSVQYMDKSGEWKNFPYREYGFNSLFNDTDAVNSGEQISG